MRFKQFIAEVISSSGDFKVTPMTAEDCIAWIEKHSHNYLDRLKAGQQIWRGTDSDQTIAYKNTNDFERRSANTYNLYTLWMDNHPQWKRYPKRSKSAICTTSSDTASGYGMPHCIIPADKALVGICPAEDLWRSFETLDFNDDHFASSTLDEFMSLCMYALRVMGYNETEIQLHWNKLEEALKQTQLDALKVSKDWKVGNPYENQLLFWLKWGGPSLYDLFQEALEPKRNGFKVQKAGDFHTEHYDQEVWVQGEIVILNFNRIKGEKTDEAKKMNAFFNEQGIYP